MSEKNHRSYSTIDLRGTSPQDDYIRRNSSSKPIRIAGVDRRPKPTTVAEGFASTATATAAEGFWLNFGRRSEKIGITFITV